MAISYHIKYKSSSDYKTIYNYIIFYLIILIMINPEILKNSENKQINFEPSCNPIDLIK